MIKTEKIERMKIRDIPKWEEFERLQRENPAEFDKLYRESIECLDKATTRASYAAIIISAISILLTLTRWLFLK